MNDSTLKPSEWILRRVEQIASEFGFWDRCVLFMKGYDRLIMQAIVDYLDETRPAQGEAKE